MSYADGSKDLYPAGVAGSRAGLNSYTSVTAHYPFPNVGIHYVYAQAGETITLASSAQQPAGTQRIRLFNPAGTEVALTIAGSAGHIANRAAELAGPADPGTSPVGSQYTPIYHTVTQTGIYQVSFLGYGSDRPGLADGDWVSGTGLYVAAWDVSVFNPGEDVFIPGRVYANVLNLAANGGGDVFHGTVYILTKDGYTYRVNANGMMGYYFTFFANNNGFTDIENNLPLYKSLNTTTMSEITGDGHQIHNPNTADTETNITHKIFYTLPAGDLPESAAGAVPGGNTWLINTVVSPNVQDVQIIGIDGTLGQVSNKGGYILFDSDAQGQYTVEIESQEIPAAFAKKTLYGIARMGSNEVFWDGTDGDDIMLPDGDIPASVTVKMQGAEVHFPYFDVEENRNGIVIELLDPDNLSNVVSDIVYWDDSDIDLVGTPSNPIDNSHLPPANSSGVSSNSNGHIFSLSFGDNKSLDTWTFIVGEEETVSTVVRVNQSDLEVVSISPDFGGGISEGGEWTYTSVIHNHGPSAVQTNTDPTNGALTRGAIFRLYVPEGIAISTDPSDITFSSGCAVLVGTPTFSSGIFEALVDMPSDCGATIAVKASVVGAVSSQNGQIYTWATILRPNDYTDINATNPDLSNPPTDPFYEANGIWTDYASVALEDPTTIDLSQTNNIKLNAIPELPPFDCNGSAYLISAPSGPLNPSTIYVIEPNSPGTVVATITPLVAEKYNGIGYNIEDNYIYGFSEGSTGAIARGNVVRFGANGAVRDLGAPQPDPLGSTAGLATWTTDPSVNANGGNVYIPTGVVGINNIFYTPVRTNNTTAYLAKVDLTSMTYTTVPLSLGVFGMDDLAFSPYDGYLYGIFQGQVYRTNPASGVQEIVTLASGSATAPTAAGGAWNDAQGRVYFYVNLGSPTVGSGRLFQYDPSSQLLNDLSAVTTYPTFDATACFPTRLEKRVIMPVDGVGPGDIIDFEFSIYNNQSLPITVDFEDELTSTDLSWVAGSVVFAGSGSGTVSISGNLLQITGITVDPLVSNGGIPLTFTVSVQIANTAEGGDCFDNQASISFGGTSVNSDDPETAELVDPTSFCLNPAAPSFTLEKSLTSINGDAAATSYSAVGDELEYTITVTNTGNVTLTGIEVNDALTGLVETIASLGPNGVETFTTTYTIDQDDLDAGSVLNTATATGEDPDGDPDGPENPDDGEVTTPGTQTPELTVTKVITGAGPYNAVGQEITYDIVVSNTGNVTIGNIVLTDANADIPAGEENIGTLAPGASTTVTVVHTITQADLDNGSVSNQALVNGDGPDGTPITEVPSDDPGTPDPNDPTDTDVEQTPAFTLVKALTGINGDVATTSYSAVGDELEYTITVTNTGNVTLSNVSVTDPLTGLVETITSLGPNGVETFTTTYTIDQDDLDVGSVLNVATALGEDPDGDPVGPEDPDDGEVTTPGTQTPELTVTKVITSAGPYNAIGQEITYDIVVANTGNVTIDNIVLTDDNADIPAGEENIGTLAPTESRTITVTHTVTQADLDNGSVSNQALVNGDGPDGTPITEVPSDDPGTPDPNDPTDTDVEQTPSFTLVKALTGINGDAAATAYSAVGDELEYTITVTNTGNVTLSNVNVTDPLTGFNQTIVSLAPGAVETFTTTYTVVQADLDNGSVLNTATAMGEDPDGDPVGPEDPDDGEVTTPGTQTPSFTLVKALTGINGDAATTSYSTVGDELEYTITLTNTGNVTLSNVSVTDPLTGFNQTIVSLAPGGVETFTTTYTIDQADLDAGSVLNTATATGEDPDGDPVGPEDPDDGEVTTPGTQTPALTVTKVITSSGPYNAIGQEITYDIVVSNTGNVTIDNIVLTDANADIPAGEENIGTLAPGASTTVTVVHTITQADLDNGSVSNQALVNGDGPDGTPITEVPSDDPGTPDPNDPTDTDVEQTPALTVTKVITSAGPYNAVGQEITYDIVVSNTGNVTIDNIVLTDDNADIPAGEENIGTLAPGTSITVTVVHTVTQADLDNGSVSNQALVNGDGPDGTPITEVPSDDPSTPDPNDPTDTDVDQTPSFTLVKALTGINGDAAATAYSAVGDELEYTITVTNTGNVTLSNVSVTDPLTGFNQTIVSLAPGGVETLTTAYTVTQSDLDNGSVLNTATATGEDLDGDPVGPENPDDGEVTTPGTQTPSFTLVKALTGINGDAATTSYSTVGDELEYTITVTNTGNVTLSNVSVTDPLTGFNQTIVSLAPGGVETFTTTYTIDQDDLDAGSVLNVATALGEDPDGDPVGPEDPDDGEVTTPGTQTPELTVTKVITGTGPYNAVGQEIIYDIVVSNTGNVTIDNIVLTDANADIPAGEENIGTLAPTESRTITVTHTVTQADLDNGIVSNQALVNGDGPDGTPITEVPSDDPGTPDPNDPTDTDVEQTPALTVTKVITSSGPYNAVGQEITYDVVVSNTGNVTIGNIVLTDANADIPAGEENIGTLAPGASTTVTVVHTITQADLDNGSVSNQALVNGDGPDGTPITEVPSDDPSTPDPNDPTDTDVEQTPSFTLVKALTGINGDAATTSYNAVGDELEYTITVTNTGNVTLSNVNVTDPLTGFNQTIVSLAPGAIETFTTTYTINQNDLGNGRVLNVATAAGEDPDGNDVDPEDPTDGEVETPGTQQTPVLTVTKVITSSGPYNAVGQEITYDVVVTNAGNVTIDNIVLTDDNVDIPAGEENIGTLAPTESRTITVTHTVTQDDLDNGTVSNQALVNGNGPDGTPITEVPSDDPGTPDPNDPTDTDVEQTPSFTLVKALTGINGDVATTSYSAVGDELEYTITVTNTGNVTLSNVNVTDPLTGFDQTIVSLAPGAIETFTTTYTINQDDLGNGRVLNVATAAGEDPDGNDVEPEDPTDGEVETLGTQTPELTVTKVITGSGPYNAVGQEITYNIVVSNTGNVTIGNIVLTDANADVPAGEENIGTLAPGASATVTVVHTITQADLDNGIVSNQALVNGNGPDGTPITEVPTDDPDTPDPDDPTETLVDQHPSITITKTARDGSYAQAGDIIKYDITVTNTGNVTLSGVKITDDNADAGSVTPATVASLAPDETVNATATHTVTEADVAAGYVYNSAKVTGHTPDNDSIEDKSHDPSPKAPDAPLNPDCPDCTVTPIEMLPAVALVKQVSNSGTGPGGLFVAGDEVVYTFTIHNTGNVSLTDLRLTDVKLGLINVLIEGTLTPGNHLTYQASYLVSEADIKAGEVVNTATTQANALNDDRVSDVSGTSAGNDTPTVISVAKGPEAVADAVSTPQHTPVTIDVLDNDEEGSGPLDPSTVHLIDPSTGEQTKEVTIPGEGTYTVETDGRITFTPERAFYGESNIRYVVRDRNGLASDPAAITVTVEQSRPRSADDRAGTSFNTPVKVAVLDNDQAGGAPLDPATIEIVDQPQFGKVVINPDGTVIYTPNQYYTGNDRFTYRVQDANGNWTDVATVEITTSGFHIPNIITPNGDGKNDRFVIIGLADYDHAEVVIFNRWGNEIYRSKDYQQDWDAQGVNEGTYYYLVTLRKGGKETSHKGWVLVKRQ